MKYMDRVNILVYVAYVACLWTNGLNGCIYRDEYFCTSE